MSLTDHLAEDATKLDISGKRQNAAAEITATRLVKEARKATGIFNKPMKDITGEFAISSDLLESGQLIKDEDFTLFEAVGALEIMDSKMDTGVVLAGEIDEPVYDPATDLTAAQTIWILDELLCLEIAWLEDYPLSQTIFTSTHIDRLLDPENKYPFPFELHSQSTVKESLTNQVLHACCLAIIKCSSMVLDLVRSQGFYEEEDFISHTFGRDLLPNLTTDEVVQRLDDATTWINANVSDPASAKALEVRVQFRKTFMQSIFGQIHGWHELISLVDGDIDSSRQLATQASECFSGNVLRHLATSTPPRPALCTAWKEAQTRWKKLCTDVSEATRLTTIWIRNNPASLQRAMWCFAARCPSVLPRSVIQDIMFVDGRIADDIPHLDLLLTDIRELVLPGDTLVDPDSFQIEAVADVRHKGSRIMETFLDGAVDEYLNLYRFICQNRARIRRDLTHSITFLNTLEEQHAATMDAEIAALSPTERIIKIDGGETQLQPLQTWVRYYKLKVMADTIHLGFETDIYLPDEMSHMYWYLSTLIIQRRSLIQHIEAFTQDRARLLKKDHKQQRFAECLVALQWYKSLRTEMEINIHLANALHSVYAVLLKLDLLRVPLRPFADPQLMHEARMKVYMSVTSPPTPTLEEFAHARTMSKSVSAALEEVEGDMRLAKAGLTALKKIPADVARYVGTEEYWQSELKRLETTAVAIVVVITQLRRAQSNNDSLEVVVPVPGKRYHDCWVVPQIKAKR